jgi:hypothetical protein
LAFSKFPVHIPQARFAFSAREAAVLRNALMLRIVIAATAVKMGDSYMEVF